MRRKIFLFWFVSVLIIWPSLDNFISIYNINFPLTRYFVFSLGLFFLIRFYLNQPKNTRYLTFFSKTMLLISLSGIFITVILGLDELLMPNHNYINLKLFIGGGLLLTLLPYFMNIVVSLDLFKAWLKVIFFGANFFLLLPVFYLITPEFSIENFSRIFFGGAFFLFLLFPYQRFRVNFVIVLGFIISLLTMAVTARRNMVVYFVSGLIFLVILLMFSKSALIKFKRPKLIFVGLISLIIISLGIIVFGISFELLIDRMSTGAESREDIVSEFIVDFNRTPIDWITGRGIFGEFQTITLALDGNLRNGIESGYLQIILKSGLLTLIPFLFISISAIIKAFTSSKNHLVKCSGIVVLVNLIDMIGFGVPFIGPKYINVFISIGFCLSPFVRNMNDLDIMKQIRI